MDDSDVERIIEQVETRYGKNKTEFAARNKTYRNVLLDQYIYGGKAKAEERLAEGKRIHVSDKQQEKLDIGFKSYLRYGKVTKQTLAAIRVLMKRGKVK